MHMGKEGGGMLGGGGGGEARVTLGGFGPIKGQKNRYLGEILVVYF
jgi:hypothetical protein